MIRSGLIALFVGGLVPAGRVQAIAGPRSAPPSVLDSRVQGTGGGRDVSGPGGRGDRPVGPVHGRRRRGNITAIAGANLDSVVGQRAAVGLLPGTVVQRSMVTDADPIPAGRAHVGVAVKGGQLPADGLAGDRVQVLRLPGQVAGSADPGAPVVLVPADVAPPVAAASATGAVAMVNVGSS